MTLCPQIDFDDEKRELVFLVDRSGSMGGGWSPNGGTDEACGIEQAKRALQLFFRSLPEDCYINIVGFGSSHQFLWPTSVKYVLPSIGVFTLSVLFYSISPILLYQSYFNVSQYQ